jgi:hypothetical protein
MINCNPSACSVSALETSLCFAWSFVKFLLPFLIGYLMGFFIARKKRRNKDEI